MDRLDRTDRIERHAERHSDRVERLDPRELNDSPRAEETVPIPRLDPSEDFDDE